MNDLWWGGEEATEMVVKKRKGGGGGGGESERLALEWWCSDSVRQQSINTRDLPRRVQWAAVGRVAAWMPELHQNKTKTSTRIRRTERPVGAFDCRMRRWALRRPAEAKRRDPGVA